ncbi:DUF6448 family protein [Rhodohalobacter sp. SW132]|nr:DUF6448 family protein [Rhodohalobacter sp. SW132]
MYSTVLNSSLLIITLLFTGLMLPNQAEAHCDSMDGPVVLAAQEALMTGDVNLVLIWVNKEQEGQIRESFQQALDVRDENEQVREMADMYFFETLVRLHRESEGATYTGLKPAGTDFGPVIPAGDHALETGSLKELRDLIVREFEAGLHAYFDEMMEAKEFDTNDVEAGRKFVLKYVEFMHYAAPVYSAVKAEKSVDHTH